MDFNAFIGKTCRVISKQNVRYSGTLQLIDPVERKIRVTDVRCHGTEDRPAEMFMPAIDTPFGLVEFNVNDLKDLRFDEDEPAGTAPAASAPPPQPQSQSQPASLPPQQQYPQATQPRPAQQQQQTVPPASFSAEKAVPAGYTVHQASAPAAAAVPTPNATAQSNTESLNRAMGGMKINGANANPVQRSNGSSPAPPRGGGRGRGRGGRGFHQSNQGHQRVEIKVPATDFDFEASNQKFDKNEAAKDTLKQLYTAVEEAGKTEVATTEEKKDDGTPKEKVYNPKASFFDNISSDLTPKQATKKTDDTGTAPNTGGSGGGRGRGRGGSFYGRQRRDEERERNVETFGEPGGVGLLGPGGYVGGYGGYRGKRRRGAPGGERGRGRGGTPRAVVHTQ